MSKHNPSPLQSSKKPLFGNIAQVLAREHQSRRDSSGSESFMGRVSKVGDCTGCANIPMCKPLLAGGCPVSPHDAAVAANQASYPKGLSTCLHPSCPAAFLVLALGHTCAGCSDLLQARQTVEAECWRQPLVCSQIGFRDYMQGSVSQ